MTNLQNEILKLLSESKLNEESLKEVKFDSVTNELVNLNKEIENVEAMLNGPAKKLQSEIDGIKNALEKTMTVYNQVETYYNNKFKGGKAPSVPSYATKDEKNTQDELSKLNQKTPTSNDVSNKDTTLDVGYWDKVNSDTPSPEVKNTTAETPQPVPPVQDTPTEVKPETVKSTKTATTPAKRKTTTKKAASKLAAESIEESNLNEGIGDIFSNMMIARQEKETVLNALQTATRNLTDAQRKINDGRLAYVAVYRQLTELYKKIEKAQKMIDKKKSWFGRTFGFWK